MKINGKLNRQRHWISQNKREYSMYIHNIYYISVKYIYIGIRVHPPSGTMHNIYYCSIYLYFIIRMRTYK